MRIIAGRHRGRPIRVPHTGDVRPTLERVRESVFDILGHGIDWPGFDGARVVDLFAGSGAYGLESLSRGASRATFVDLDAGVLHQIRKNAAALGEARSIALLRLDATRLPPPAGAVGAPCGLAFLDPPYDSGLAIPALQGLAGRGWLATGAIAVIEVGRREPFAPPPAFTPIDERPYGAARVIFLKLG
jgi:16S rRNA (guanine966-N2)-methyltransferase